MATFGQNSIVGYSSSDFIDDHIRANNLTYSPTKDGIANSISLYCNQNASDAGNMCFALYDSSDGSLVAKTEEIAVTTTEGWHTANFITPPNVYASKNYYICLWFAPNVMSIWDKTDEEDGRYLYDLYDADYPASITSWNSTAYDHKFAIYCTYTPTYKKDLTIYYDSLAGTDFINCWCSRWDVQNYNIVVETWINKTDLSTLRSNITPGATGELYKILGRPTFYDKTWQGENTLMLSPNTDANSNLKSMRSDTIIYVKNITTHPIEGSQGWIEVKIEGLVSGSSSL